MVVIAIYAIQPNSFFLSILFDVLKHFFSYFFCAKKWLFILGGEDKMYPDSYPTHNFMSSFMWLKPINLYISLSVR